MDQASNLRKIIKSNEVTYKTNSARVITVTSGKGGVGKSNISVNLAINFRRQGKRVVIFDADFGLANIEVIFGISPKHTLFDIIYNDMSMAEVLTSAPFGIEFISGGSGIQELANLNKNQINYLINKLYELDSMTDIIIIDTGAGISDNVLDFVVASDEILLVTTPEPTAVTDAYALLKSMKKREEGIKEKKVNLLVNKASNENESLEIYQKLYSVSNKFLNLELHNIGYLPYDKSLEKAVIEQKPVSMIFPRSNISQAFERLADHILNDTMSTKNKQTGLSALFENLLKLRKMK